MGKSRVDVVAMADVVDGVAGAAREPRCSDEQKLFIERVGGRMKREDLLQLCSKVAGRRVRSVAQLEPIEASLVLDELGYRRKR